MKHYRGIYFGTAKDGHDILFYVRKAYKKARYKRKLERLSGSGLLKKKSERNDQLVKKLEKIYPEKETE